MMKTAFACVSLMALVAWAQDPQESQPPQPQPQQSEQAQPEQAQSEPEQAPDPATTAELSIEARREQERQRLEMTLKHLPALPPRQIEEIFSLSVRDGFIVVHPKLLEETGGQVRVDVPDLEGITLVQMIGNPEGGPDRAVALNVQNHMFDRPELILMITHVFMQPQRLHIGRSADWENRFSNMDLIQAPLVDELEGEQGGEVSFMVQALENEDQETVRLRLTAESFSELRRKYPSETQAYLRPVLRDLKQEHILAVDPRLGWQVLAKDLQVDETLRQRIDQIVARFDSEKFQEREAAAQELRKLGQAAAMELMKADRSDWSVERQTAVEDFLAEFRLVEHQDEKVLGDSPAFLLDCLYGDDQALRETAHARLKELHPEEAAEIDPNAPEEQRYEKIDELYRKLLPPPATRSSSR